MAHVASKSYLLLSRRLLAVMAEKVKPQAVCLAKSATSSATRINVVAGESGAVRAAESSGSGSIKDIFWMKDPKTGYWKPETHFNEVDPVELRQRFLGKKH